MNAGLARKLLGPVFRLMARVLLVVAVLPALYAIEPFRRIRLVLMPTQRLGELSANMDFFVRRQQLRGREPRTEHLFFGWDPCNRQLFRMFQRLPGLRVFDSRWGTRLLSAWQPILKHTRFLDPLHWDYAEYFIFNNTRSALRFTEAEEREGRARLAEMGIGEKDWFICFHARDGAYLRQWRPQYNGVWAGNDFKNTRIENYLKAAEYIASLGGFAVRIGAVVESPLPETGNPRIIDYASKYRSDFMDIYLLAKCRFFLATSSGPAAVTIAFDVPCVVTSHYPYSHSSNHGYDIMLPRLVATPDGNRVVGFYDAADKGYYADSLDTRSKTQDMSLFQWRESDPDDILDGCKDMIEQLEGRAPPPEARALQAAFADRYLSRLPDYKLAGKIGPRWALKYRSLIVPDQTASPTMAAARR